MGKVLTIFAISLFYQVTSVAGDSYFLENKNGCSIKLFSDGSFSEIDSTAFIKRTLDIKTLKKNPSKVAFKIDGNIYVTNADCVESVSLDEDYSAVPAKAVSFVEGQKKVKAIRKKKVSTVTKSMFVEFDGGPFFISDQSQVSRDYNETFPSETTNPTSWSKAEKSKYDSGMMVSMGLGFKQTDNRSLVFKLRSLSGKKVDTLTLTDVNSGLSQTGDWIYEDSFLNLYGGYRFHFFNHSLWRAMLSGYLGLSKTTTKLTDNSVSYNLSSLGIAVLMEAAVERMLGDRFAASGAIGFEFLGPRTLKFDEASGKGKIKTKMSYNNTYLSLGIKYYF